MFVFASFLIVFSSHLYGLDVQKKYALELDPLMPVAASLKENTADGSTANMWGANFEFNLRGQLSTGPEIWYGKFVRRGNKSDTSDTLDAELYKDEKVDIEAFRIRWIVGIYENPSLLSGWYLKSGLSYTRVRERADLRNRRSFSLKDGTTPSQVDSSVLDLRQGLMIGVGQRWLAWKERASFTLGTSYTYNFSRNINVNSDDPHARDDYDAMIESFPGARISSSNFPEANLTFGYLF